jgi:hypothetical protein
LNFLERPGAGVALSRAQPRTQQVIATEDIQRQIAVVAVVAVKKATLLFPVQRIIGGVQIEHDLLRWAPVRFDKELEQ